MPKRSVLDRSLDIAKVDFAPEHASDLSHCGPRGAGDALCSVAWWSSLGVDAILVAIGEATFPSTKGYVHFAFGDYAKLTIIGVIIACMAWPVATRISSSPRWLFLRLAILVTLVLLLHRSVHLDSESGQPARKAV